MMTQPSFAVKHWPERGKDVGRAKGAGAALTCPEAVQLRWKIHLLDRIPLYC